METPRVRTPANLAAVLTGAVLVVVGVSVAATYLSARQAARLDPAILLKRSLQVLGSHRRA
jgi:hypothetical protein